MTNKERNRNYRKRHPFRMVLHGIKNRCNNPNSYDAKYYHDKGIKCEITEEEIKKIAIRDHYWDMIDPTIDRKNVRGNYTFDNCQFIERSLNSRKDKIKAVLQYDLDGFFIKEWESAVVASKKLKINHSHIISVCLNRQGFKTAGGYNWTYKDSNIINNKQIIFGHRKPVLQYDLQGNFIKEFKSLTEASILLNISRPGISHAILGKSKTASGYIWKLKLIKEKENV